MVETSLMNVTYALWKLTGSWQQIMNLDESMYYETNILVSRKLTGSCQQIMNLDESMYYETNIFSVSEANWKLATNCESGRIDVICNYYFLGVVVLSRDT